MTDKTSDSNRSIDGGPDNEVKWDYTSSRQNFITGALVVGGNLLVVIIFLLYRSVPSVHQFISGKPL